MSHNGLRGPDPMCEVFAFADSPTTPRPAAMLSYFSATDSGQAAHIYSKMLFFYSKFACRRERLIQGHSSVP